MQTIAAREIKRRGIAAVDDDLPQGPVHVIKNDRPSYVILDEARYQELLEIVEEAELLRIQAALEDERTGRVRRVTARQLIDDYDLES